MSTRSKLLSPSLSLSLALAASVAAFGCVGQVGSSGGDNADAAPGAGADSGLPGGNPATATFQKVAVTSLPGSSLNAGVVGTFKPDNLQLGQGGGPTLSNNVLSSVPGTPPKPLFVGQGAPFDAVLVAVEGQSGYFEIPAGGNTRIGLDLVSALAASRGTVTVQIATKRGDAVSAATPLTMLIDPHVFVAAGDLENHDSDGSNIADLFGTFLEGRAGNPPAPTQVLDDTDNNQEIVDGVKGPPGPALTGHREVVWDGVPEALRNKPDFNENFFDRQNAGTAGVRGGVIFKATNGTGQEVNDALGGATPDPALVGPPANENAEIGGDFSNHSLQFTNNLLSFTQSAQFAPLGTTITDLSFHVAGSQQKAIVHGVGIVFSSVDKPETSYVEYFDENDVSIAKVFAPVQSKGPFPFPGPQVVDKFSYSFVGYVDLNARIARVRVVSGEVPLDLAIADYPNVPQDVAVFDDVYYSEPTP